RDTAYSLDDRETFVAKYLKPTTPVANLANISESPESSAVKFDDNEAEDAADEDEEAEDEDSMSVHDLVDDDIPRVHNDDDDEAAHEEDIQEVDTLVTLGIAMLQKGSASGAVAAFERAVELLPRDPLLYSYLGKAYYADEDLDRAVLALERSLDLVPSAANSTLLGKILFEKGDHDKAILAYQRSLEIQRGN
ncbi:hypothetical protein SPRG_18590, partial [Saprolegnia parasitica CBS 223.65]